MTTVVRWNPVRDMATMQSVFERFFDESQRGTRADVGALALDVHDTDKAYTVSAVLPGVSAEAVTINLHDNVLTISAEIPQVVHENSRALMLERSYGKVQRSIRLPQPIDGTSVEATMDNGVLSLTLNKTAEAQPRTIPVKTANFSNN